VGASLNFWRYLRSRYSANASLTIVLIAIMACPVAAWAQSRFDIRSAYVEPADGVYELNATLNFDLPEGARAVIRDGVPLTLHLEIVVRRQRNYWFGLHGRDARSAVRARLSRAQRALPRS
jgi:hypothetical protein